MDILANLRIFIDTLFLLGIIEIFFTFYSMRMFRDATTQYEKKVYWGYSILGITVYMLIQLAVLIQFVVLITFN
jgi:hypothetical protein